MERLKAQGVDISSAVGILAAVHGSGEISMEDFDTASRAIHEQISQDANVIVGVISDENLGGNVKVTILAIHWCQRRSQGALVGNFDHKPYMEAMDSTYQSSSKVNASML